MLFAFQKEKLMSRLYLPSPSVLIELCPFSGKSITTGYRITYNKGIAKTPSFMITA